MQTTTNFDSQNYASDNLLIEEQISVKIGSNSKDSISLSSSSEDQSNEKSPNNDTE